MRRVFLGIPLPLVFGQQIVDDLKNHQSQLIQHKLKWLRYEQMHVTVHFFGDVDHSSLLKLVQALQSVISPVEKFPCQLNRVANFPRPQGHIIAAYVQLSEPLAVLYASIQQSITEIGFSPEQRPYQPHITLCRIGRRVKVSASPMDVSSVQFTVKEVVLYQSKLSSAGSEYVKLEQFKLMKCKNNKQ